MGKTFRGSLVGSNLRIGIVVARFNDFITNKLLEGAVNTLKQHGVKEDNIDIAWVPGAFEIPVAAQKMAMKVDYDAVVTLGAVIRGSTPHFDYVCREAAGGIANAGQHSEKPVIFGVLTTDTTQQAIERAGTKSGNKGSEAAAAAIETANVIKELSS
ncbi:6,7-dimethyl-8-ribityllumazine synthase [Barrientosiimonas marina]|uniref:6,7-dimethyl-8-ribityllumazine synthase n=1 Tax=Lentibacillus kimchii TaxID=1542911 RepID=A0ABW2US98_9BACI